LELQKAKATLEKIAFFDPLTNIPNRRFFIDQSNRLIQSCNRRNVMIAFGIIDIDDFKVLNDTYGHNVGDAVLVAFSKNLKHFFRIDDAFCRHGGEEFAFAVAIENATDLKSLADRLISGIRNIVIEMDRNTQLSITVSIGIKLCNPSSDLDLEIEIKQADIALYQSKENGKNKYTIVSDNQ
jgi:diguanylate cyclase (GGDEF)-like protein